MSSADAAAALEAKVNSAQRLWRASSSQMPAAKRDRAARDAKSLPDYLHMGDQERSTSAAEMKGGAV